MAAALGEGLKSVAALGNGLAKALISLLPPSRLFWMSDQVTRHKLHIPV